MVRKPSVYLLLGPEQILRDKHIRQISQSVFQAGDDASINTQTFDASKDKTAPILDFASTSPFLASAKLLIIQNTDQLPTESKKEIIEYFDATQGGFAAWVFISDELKTKTAFLKQIASMGETRVCGTSYGDGDARNYCRQWFQAKGKKIDSYAISKMIELLGPSLTELDKACDQLDLLTQGRPDVRVNDVIQLLGESKERNVFEIYEALKNRRVPHAVQIMRQMKSNGVRSTQILAGLIQQFDRILKIKSLRARGMDQQEIAQELRWHPYAVKMACAQADRLQQKTLLQDLITLRNAEVNLKKGLLREDLALDQCLCCLGEIQTLR